MSAPTFAHLNVPARLFVPNPTGAPDPSPLDSPLDKAHLPAGCVSLSAIIRMLIEGFGVRPLASTRQARLTEATMLLGKMPGAG